MTESEESTVKRDLVLTRLLNAPVDLVWKAWSEAQYVQRWWGPTYFTSPMCRIDFREGGRTLVSMRSPEGQDSYSIWDYGKIVPMQRIEYVQNPADEHANPITDPAAAGLPPDFPLDVLTVVTFKPVGDKTEVTITEHGLPVGMMGLFAELGLHQCLDKLYAIYSGA